MRIENDKENVIFFDKHTHRNEYSQDEHQQQQQQQNGYYAMRFLSVYVSLSPI